MFDTDAVLARQLLDAQFPEWAALPLTLVDDSGSDKVTFQLGDDLSVRFPREDLPSGQVQKEHAWLPRLAAQLPVATPVPLGLGVPGLGYPYHWSVTRRLDGVAATVNGFADHEATAVQLAGFLKALWQFEPADDRDGLSDWSLIDRDEETRAFIDSRRGALADAMRRVWTAALDAPAWGGPPVWFHGDFRLDNLLIVDGRLSAVRGFGGLGLGDPACDLMIGWSLLGPETRDVFRAELAVDDATWARGRGWALAVGINGQESYAATNPQVARQFRRQITEAISDAIGG